jgi:hypothetical protein
LPGDNSLRRISDFLYRYEVRNLIKHAAILGRVDNRHALTNFSQPETCYARSVTFQPAVTAFQQRNFQLFRLRHRSNLFSLIPGQITEPGFP